jgi:hypothetical protein
MNQALVDQIAAAVLYEGYILYPYRPSVKNRQRWTFGSLVPQDCSQAREGSDACEIQTQCLVLAGPQTTLTISVRFLQIVARLVRELESPLREWPPAGEPPCRLVESLRVGDQVFYTWQEAVERKIDLAESSVSTLVSQPRHREFSFDFQREREPLRDAEGMTRGVIVREQRPIAVSVELGAEEVGEGVVRVSVTIRNRTPMAGATDSSREEALLNGLASVHTVLVARDGEFISQIDPPEAFRDLSSACRNIGAWPVLVGTEGDKDTMLSAPIILYDYPRIAPESPGELFDSTEIDEILTLRIMTLTEEEKRAMTAVDARARAVLERTTALGQDQLLGLHGTFRGLRPVTE